MPFKYKKYAGFTKTFQSNFKTKAFKLKYQNVSLIKKEPIILKNCLEVLLTKAMLLKLYVC